MVKIERLDPWKIFSREKSGKIGFPRGNHGFFSETTGFTKPVFFLAFWADFSKFDGPR